MRPAWWLEEEPGSRQGHLPTRHSGSLVDRAAESAPVGVRAGSDMHRICGKFVPGDVRTVEEGMWTAGHQ
jgi:hypothetical protein